LSDPVERLNAALGSLGKNRRVLPLIIGSLLLPLGWGCNDDPTGPTDPFCSSQPASAIVTFEDANLQVEIRAALGIGAQEDLTCGLVSGLTTLEAPLAGIMILAGIENLATLTTLNLDGNSLFDISDLSGLTNLTALSLRNNSITNLGPLSGLTSLATLDLYNNLIIDISALRELTSLTLLNLGFNSILGDIQPLLDNTGLGASDTVDLTGTSVSCADVNALGAKGVAVTSDCV